ncbi:MAG: site-specific integrase [Mesorhizobium sp.]|uniref:tyrosine-type recombinase/integrase n=1 Tax=Mesorhizobium sp. TaxID=1871066 RepID=UPI000FE50F47|nr:site-specific integrase [Mesorhizobium sp.]RWC92309.1 MAG: site-specific integrase [Mesorhizobium sp.]
MARTVRDAKLETRAARSRLPKRDDPHWRTLVPGELHLGYRKRRADAPGKWLVRRYLGAVEKGKNPYQKETLGFADDYRDADGMTVLSYADVQRRAHDWAAAALRGGAVASPRHPTVRDLVEDYVAFLKAERRTGRDADRRASNFILPQLGGLKVSELTTGRLVQWRDALAASPARLRTRKGREQRYRAAPATPGEARARRATVNRTVTVLKAALNRAFEHGRVNDDLAWRRLKPFDKVDVARPGHLSIAEAQRLINSADATSGFRDVAHGALLTGCRYGELCRLLVGDFQRGRIVVRESKSGKPRDVRLTDEAASYFRTLAAGRPADALMFTHADGSAWAKSHQARPMRDACATAQIVPAVGFHQLRHTWASLAVMNGMPLMIVAENLGHTDTRMVEKHYGHLTEDYRDEAIRTSGPRFGVVTTGNVVPLEARR